MYAGHHCVTSSREYSASSLSSSSNACWPAAVSVGTPELKSLPKYLGTNLGAGTCIRACIHRANTLDLRDALSFPLRRIIPLLLLNRLLVLRRFAVFLPQEPAGYTLPETPALIRELAFKRSYQLRNYMQHGEIQKSRIIRIWRVRPTPANASPP